MHKLLGLSSHLIDNGQYSEKVNMFAEVLDNPHSCIALRSMGHVANTYRILTIKVCAGVVSNEIRLLFRSPRIVFEQKRSLVAYLKEDIAVAVNSITYLH